MGSWVSRFQGTANPSIPANLSLMYPTGESRWGDPYTGGFLGMAHNPFNLVGGRTNMSRSAGMTLNGITLDRLGDRVGLLHAFDTLNRQLDRARHDGRHGRLRGSRPSASSRRRGWSTPSTCRKEDPRVVARYGVDDPAFQRDGAPRMVRNFCIARRLVEAGARVVTLNFSRWDWHGAGRQELRREPPQHAAARHGRLGAGRRSARARPGPGRVGGGLGRVRPHAAHQQHRRPRSLAAGQLRPARRRRHEDGPGHRRDATAPAAPRRAGRSSSRKSSRRCIATSA